MQKTGNMNNMYLIRKQLIELKISPAIKKRNSKIHSLVNIFFLTQNNPRTDKIEIKILPCLINMNSIKWWNLSQIELKVKSI